MVTNKEVQSEFDMFSAVWKYYKKMLSVHSEQDDKYWQEVVGEAEELIKQYPTKLCKSIVMDITSELERKAKIYDSDIAKRK